MIKFILLIVALYSQDYSSVVFQPDLELFPGWNVHGFRVQKEKVTLYDFIDPNVKQVKNKSVFSLYFHSVKKRWCNTSEKNFDLAMSRYNQCIPLLKSIEHKFHPGSRLVKEEYVLEVDEIACALLAKPFCIDQPTPWGRPENESVTSYKIIPHSGGSLYLRQVRANGEIDMSKSFIRFSALPNSGYKAEVVNSNGKIVGSAHSGILEGCKKGRSFGELDESLVIGNNENSHYYAGCGKSGIAGSKEFIQDAPEGFLGL